jgi:hypothetical protein
MDNDLMDSIEPYDYKAAVPFQTAYMAGYMADKYDVTAEESRDRANDRIKRSSVGELNCTVKGYTSVQPEHQSVSLSNTSARYALLPVWILNTKWRDTNYTFAMNGQTGKFVGNLPMDKSLKTKYFWQYAGITAGVFTALSLLFTLIGYLMRMN